MKNIAKLLIISLGMLLPWHGIITVFLPEPFRYWKEFILVLLFLVALLIKSEIPSFAAKIKGYFHDLFSKKTETRERFWQKPIFWAALFLIWLGMVSGVEQDYYSSLAARYLGFGFFVFIIFTIFLRKCGEKSTDFFNLFSSAFVWSALLSVLFGIWGKFGGGFEVLENFYSMTISSWVPGQTIPLYHEIGDFIRMQGGASGPIEFGHLLFVALFLITQNKIFTGRFITILGIIILFFGVVQSGSRAALGGSLILLILFFLQKIPQKKIIKASDSVLKYTKILLGITLFLAIIKILVLNFLLLEKVEQKTINYHIETVIRLGDSDHLARPIEAMKEGMKNPLSGALGTYGPAARIRNLTEKNNDQAPIAENIFADYLVQLGFIGLFLALAFWWNLLLVVSRKCQIFILTTFLLVNFATIFDMTPLSILFFTIFAFLSNKHTKNYII